MERLEMRRLFAAIAHVSSRGTLIVTGTSGDDAITLALSDSDLQVAVNQTVQAVARSLVKRIYIDAGAGNDFVVGDSHILARTTIFGNGGDDTLTGDGGDNDLLGGAGNDRLQGLGGNDTLDGSAGADFMFGSTGNNWVDYSARTNAVHIKLGDTNAVQGESGEGDTIVQVSGVIGGSGNDSITSIDPTLNVSLYGEAGNDTLTSQGGRDVLVGGIGADVMDGGSNSDTLIGQGGNDQLAGNLGADSIEGDAGNDRLFGNGGNDVVMGGSGNDQIFGAGGNDSLYGNAGNDLLDGGAGNDRLLGSGGSNTLLGQSGNDTLISIASAADSMNGGSGADRGQFDASDNVTSIESLIT